MSTKKQRRKAVIQKHARLKQMRFEEQLFKDLFKAIKQYGHTSYGVSNCFAHTIGGLKNGESFELIVNYTGILSWDIRCNIVDEIIRRKDEVEFNKLYDFEDLKSRNGPLSFKIEPLTDEQNQLFIQQTSSIGAAALKALHMPSPTYAMVKICDQYGLMEGEEGCDEAWHNAGRFETLYNAVD